MILIPDLGDIPDLSSQLEPGPFRTDPGEIPFSIIEQDMAKAGVQPAELWQEAGFVAPENQVGKAIAIEVHAMNGVHGRQLYHGGHWPYAEPPVAFIDGDDGRGVIELPDQGAVQHFLREQFLDRPFGKVTVFQILFFERWDLYLHVVLEEDRHILSVDRAGHDLVGDAVLVEIIYP